jgi:hypothetical protein
MKKGGPLPKGHLETFVPAMTFKFRFLILSFPLQRYILRNIGGAKIVETHDCQFESMGVGIYSSCSTIHDSPSMLIHFPNCPSNSECNLVDVIQYCSSSIPTSDKLCSTRHELYSNNLPTESPSHGLPDSFSFYKYSLS